MAIKAQIVRTIDGLVFASFLFLSLLLSTEGKFFSSYSFYYEVSLTSWQPNIYILFLILVSVVSFSAIRIATVFKPSYTRILFGGLTTMVFCFGYLVFSDSVSPLVFFLVLGVHTSTTLIVFFETYLNADMEVNFWQLAFDSIIRLFQAGLLFIALTATALGVITKDRFDFATTLAYPMLVVLVQIGAITYWVLFPIWNRIFDSYRIDR